MKKDHLPSANPNRIVLSTAPDGKVTVNVFFARDNFWLPQRAIAELFGVGIAAISKHLKNVFESGELTPKATISKMETVQSEGERQVTRVVGFYNLDAVIAVGSRLRSPRGMQFRRWAEPLAPGTAAGHKEFSPADRTTLVFRGSAFADDIAKTNLTAILQQHGFENVRSL